MDNDRYLHALINCISHIYTVYLYTHDKEID